MKYFDQSSKNRPSPHWTKLAAASLLAVAALAGCGGGSTGPAGPAGSAGGTGATGPQGPAGNNGLDFTNKVSIASNATPAPAAAAAAWAALAPQVTVQSVTINSAPVVRFTVKDAAGNPIIGLGNKSQSATASVAGLTNIAFTLAKLVPATSAQVTSGSTTTTISTEPSKWVSYLVTSVPTVTQKAGTIAASASCDSATAPTWCGSFPGTDAQGTLVDNGDGSYQYTFYRDVTQAKAIVATLIDSTDGLAKKADLGDLTYDATLTHRLGIQLGGAAPGTGSNTPNAATNAAYPTVNMVNTANAVYDFRPDGAAVTNTRDIVKIDSCSSCHDGKVLAHGSRKDPRYCMTCHTDQIKYTFSAEASKASAFVLNGTTRPTTAILDGRAIGNYPNMIHKTHMGKELVMSGYFFNAAGEGKYNSFGFPQDPSNCTKCHTGTATAGNPVVTTNGDNWKTTPSILACGACHDGIDFTSGTGVTLADKAKDLAAGVAIGTTQSGHTGKAKSDNTTCALCHDASTTPVDHRATIATPNNPVAKAGVATFTFGITSVTVNSSRQPVITFQIKKDGVAVTSLTAASLVTNAASGAQVVSPAFEPISGFTGGPSLYVTYAVPEDGITAPADFNVYQNVSLTNLLVAAGSSPNAGTLVSDGAGNFTATLTGDLVGQPAVVGCPAVTAPAVATCISTVTTGTNKTPVLASPIVIPANAKMVTGAILGSFTQKGLTAYPYVAANVSVNPNVSAKGGLATPGVLKKLVATGYTARRVVVATANCNTCHDQLGTNPSFHGGARNDPTSCAICHNNTRTSNGWVANSNTFVHGIHGASKRIVGYTWAGASATDNYSFIGYPGVLKDCNQCHLPNTVNFGATGTALQPNLLWPTGASGTISTTSNTFRNSPYVVAGTNYGVGFSYVPAGATVAAYTPLTGPNAGVLQAAHIAGAGGETIPADTTTLVSSPISAACFSCHDTDTAKNHMKTNGGAVYEARSTALTKGEACLACHGAGKDYDAAVVHQ